MTKQDVAIWAEEDFGAATFLIKIAQDQNADYIFQKLETTTIRGNKLWVLWKEICNMDMHQVFVVLSSCPATILENACSQVDHSGEKLVDQYIN